jgi:hypothetical protein
MVEHLISEDCNTKSHIKILEQLDKKGSGRQVLNGKLAVAYKNQVPHQNIRTVGQNWVRSSSLEWRALSFFWERSLFDGLALVFGKNWIKRSFLEKNGLSALFEKKGAPDSKKTGASRHPISMAMMDPMAGHLPLGSY